MIDDTRPAAVAGMFYTDNADELRRQVRAFLDQAVVPDWPPRAVVSPHAGYMFSGVTAGFAWASAARRTGSIKRVLLLGPSHRVPFRGLATSPAARWQTPLGSIDLDQDGAEQLQQLTGLQPMAAAHAEEHSLEVQVPFIQIVFPKAQLLPLVVGDASPSKVAEVIKPYWDDEETLIAISTDLSHFHDYPTAQQIDTRTTQAIEQCDYNAIGPEQACGCRPLDGLLKLAAEHDCSVITLDQRNSGDTAGDRSRVVGYGAYAVQ